MYSANSTLLSTDFLGYHDGMRTYPCFAVRFGFILMLGLLVGGCLSFNPVWTYPNPPKIDDYFTLEDKFIWCDSIQGARYTAITGWFGPGCHYTQLNMGHYKVIQLSHEQFETTKVIIVKCLGKDGEIWLPLPSHKWA